MTQEKGNIIGKRIRQAREGARPRLTQDDLGRKLGYKDGAYISRWESGDRIPGTKSLQKLAEIFDKPLAWFFTEGLTIPDDGIKLPSLINIIRRQLDEATHRYELSVKKQQLREVPVMVIDTAIPKPFLIPTNGTIQIPESELSVLDPKVLDKVVAIQIVTDLGNEFDIYVDDYVLLLTDPDPTEGGLFLITYQGIMSFRNITWRPPTLIDAKGIKTPFKMNNLEMSGEVIKIWKSRNPKRYTPQP